jgi:hypothetical protein
VEITGDTELKAEIAKCNQLDEEVEAAIDTIKSNGPQSLKKGLQEWNLDNGLIMYKGKIYVPKDMDLRRKIVKSYHDPPLMGHPGRYKTQEWVSRTYWWPSMSAFVKAYVDGCAICQESKIHTHPTKMPLHPTQIPSRPFQYITVDFIVKLPESNGYDSIMMATCQFSKAMVTVPCNEKIDASGTADLLIKHVFCIYGIPDKMISDRGPQFAAQVMQAIMKALGVTSALRQRTPGSLTLT